MSSLRNVPILATALVLQCVSGAVQLVMHVTHASALDKNIAVELAFRGVWYAVIAGLVVGCLELADRLGGRARLGAHVAAAGFALRLVFSLLPTVAQAVHEFHGGSFFTVTQWCSFGADALAGIGLLVAAWDRRVPALAAFAIATLAQQALGPYLVSKVVTLDSLPGYQTVGTALLVVRGLGLLYLVDLAQPAAPLADAARAARGLRRCAASLWLRLIAALAAVLLALVAVGGGESMYSIIKFAVVSALAFELVLVVVFALGALGVARAAPQESSRTPFVVGGFAALWCAGVVAIKTCEAYRQIYGHGGGSSFSEKSLLALSLVEPVIAVLCVAAVLLGLRRIAALASLAELAGSRMAAYALLMCSAVAIQAWGLPEAHSESSALAMLLVATVLTLVAIGMAAGILSRAAQTMEMQQPDVPEAKVVG